MEIKIGSNKSFGIVFFVVFIIVGFWPLLDFNTYRLWAIIIALIFLTLGIMDSRLLNPLNILWFKFGLFLGKIVSPIVIGIIFFVVVTPTGFLMRLLKKDLLNLKFNNKDSYWVKKNEYKSKMKNQY
jgi:hypothetical protein